MDESGWSLTESDPQVFTELLRGLGVTGLQVDDLYSLDAGTLAALRPIHALIFLFKYVGGADAGEVAGVEVDPADVGVWFANQVINNSCGTLAALNAVLNIPVAASPHPGESIALGDELHTLKEFGSAMGSLDLGHALASSPTIREVHNSFSKSTPFALDPAAFPEREKEDAYHFVAYVPVNGCVYELDGLRPAPLMHAAYNDAAADVDMGGEGEGGVNQDWLDKAREIVEERIARYPPGSLMFNLLAVRSAAVPRLQRRLAGPELDSTTRAELADQLAHEQAKAARGRVENALRRSNLLPAVFELFKALRRSDVAPRAVEDARAKGRERRARAAKDDHDE
ncbi:hypothetical protein Q5752_000051 [Cryptotrichosporon argae]